MRRLPPLSRESAPPVYARAMMYKQSLRPIILFISFFGGLWALLWGIASFRDISIDKDHAVKLEIFDIVLGSLYMIAFAIELLGLIGAAMQNIKVVHAYAIGSLGAAVIVTATELMRVIIHFVFKNTLISECEALANGDVVEERFGLWFHRVEVNSENAPQICSDAWSHDSFSEIAWFLVTSILSFLFASLAFAYYRQMLDPNFSRTRQPNAGAPAHYESPYGFSYGRGSDTGAGGYAPPPGPPPAAQSTAYVPQYDPVKLPEYDLGAEGAKYGEDRKDGVSDPFADFAPTTTNARRGEGEGSREREGADHV